MMPTTSMPVLAFVATLAAGVPHALPAQDPAGFDVVDRVVAVVGGKPILLSKVEETINIARAIGQEVPADSAQRAALVRQLLQSLVDEELIIQAAEHDTDIVVSNQEVQLAVEDQLKQIRQQFGSDQEIDRELQVAGFGTLDEYRRWLSEQKRRESMRRQFIQKLRQKGIIAPIQPTEREARAFYDSARTAGQLPKRPAAVTFRQIPVRPRPDSAALARARRRADSVVIELRRGADFAAAARRFSDDPATKEFGGDLGWFRRGAGYAREFEFVAFSLRPGQISDPVLTAFGYHIIQVQRIEPAEVQARHILFAPEITDQDRARTGIVADSIAALLKAGASFDSLARLYGDPTEEFVLDRYPKANLPEAYGTALAGARPGDIVGPFPAEGPGGVTKQVVVAFQEEVAEGEYTYEELRDQIRGRLAEEGVIKRYVALLRSQTYVDIRL